MKRSPYSLSLIDIGNVRGFRFGLQNLTNKFTLKIIVFLMLINLLISILILNQQTKMSLFFNAYYNRVNEKKINQDLLITLNLYRSRQQSKTSKTMNNEEVSRKIKFLNNLFNESYDAESAQKTHNIQQKDYLFNRESFVYDFLNSDSASQKKKFHEPKILIDNKRACSKLNKRYIFLVCLIHSHKNNYLRRQSMRDTWLSMNKVNMFDMINENFRPPLNKKTNSDLNNLHIVHLFILGNGNNETEPSSSYEAIKRENALYNDLLMIDTPDNYQNLIYKHLTAVKWVVENCAQATYVMKLDDDVFVNIKSVTKHLITRFGVIPTSNSKFLYCSMVDMAIPARNNESKWYVNYDAYPFDYYPRYCEGFSYITNIPTLRVVHEQSKIIPRFWIDDVYVTGLLLFGVDDLEWFNYNHLLKWSFYDFWDLGNSYLFYELYAKMMWLFNVQSADYYRADYFVVIHAQNDNKEINYESQLSNETKKNCTHFNYDSKNKITIRNNQMLKCFNDETIKYNLHFYNFCERLWLG